MCPLLHRPLYDKRQRRWLCLLLQLLAMVGLASMCAWCSAQGWPCGRAYTLHHWQPRVRAGVTPHRGTVAGTALITLTS
jgi:hypothetical protein